MFHAKSVRGSDECVATVIRAINRYLKLGICTECVVTMVAHDYRMDRKMVRRVWTANIDQCPVADARA